MIRRYLSLLLLFACFYNFSECFATVRIDSVHTTVSRCPNSGMITVFATTDKPPILYSILSGPETRPYQNDPLFQGLFPGTYVIQASDISGAIDTFIATVDGSNYTEPDFTWTAYRPQCYNTPNGVIIANPDQATREPVHWVLTNTVRGDTIRSTIDSINILPGTYSMRMYDSCENFVTRQVIVPQNTDTFLAVNTYSFKTGCDTVIIEFDVFTHSSDPLKFITYASGDSIIRYITASTIFDTLPGLSYGETIPNKYVIENSCGIRRTILNDKIPPFMFTINYGTIDELCKQVFAGQVELTNPFLDLGGYFPLIPKRPLLLTVTDIDSNKIAEQNTDLTITPKVAGRNYLITVTDGCGTSYSFDTIWPAPVIPPSTIDISKDWGCIDSTAYIEFHFQSLRAPAILQILSGPKYLHSTTPGFSYFDSILYPKVYEFHDFIPAYHGLKNLPPGTYRYQMTDTCGHVINDSFAITDDDIALFNTHAPISLSYKNGCLDQNILYYHLHYDDRAVYSFLKVNLIERDTTIFSRYLYYFQQHSTDSFINVAPAIYEVVLNVNTNAIKINETIDDCVEYRDTIDVKPYQRPSTNSYSVIYCNGNGYVELHPDSSRGVPPYRYEIIQGPQLYPVQASNIFDLIPVGNYVARIYDTCGNSNVFNFGVDTLIFPSITTTGSSCLGGSVTLSYPSSPFYTYSWTRPDGSLYTGDTLRINIVTPSDAGLYHITRYVNINGCRDSFTTTFDLQSNNSIIINDTICEGDSVLFRSHIYTQTGTYFDTVPSNACDTIYTINVMVLPTSITNIDTMICFGMDIFFHQHLYNRTGTYSDTLFTQRGCDSIVTLHLSVAPNIDVDLTASRYTVTAPDTLQLNAASSMATSFEWKPAAVFNNNTIPNPIALITQSTWIYVIARDRNQCMNTDSVFINILTSTYGCAPNAFSPNGDGINDFFEIPCIQGIANVEFNVFNRWGIEVYRNNQYLNNWDGKYNGSPLPDGTYFYMLKYQSLPGERTNQTGFITLHR